VYSKIRNINIVRSEQKANKISKFIKVFLLNYQTDKTDRTDRTDRTEKTEKTEKTDKTDRQTSVPRLRPVLIVQMQPVLKRCRFFRHA
jgi:hypothetical protein